MVNWEWFFSASLAWARQIKLAAASSWRDWCARVGEALHQLQRRTIAFLLRASTGNKLQLSIPFLLHSCQSPGAFSQVDLGGSNTQPQSCLLQTPQRALAAPGP